MKTFFTGKFYLAFQVVSLLIILLPNNAFAQWQPSGPDSYILGNVGIGTSAPNLKLQVATSASLDGFGLQHNNGAWTNFFSPSMTGGAYNGITQAGDAGLIFGNHAGINTVSNGFVIAPHRNTTSGLRITKEGNVGIGTANPNQLLTVNGTIYGREVKVDLQVPGPDYGFEENYALPSLERGSILYFKVQTPARNSIRQNYGS